MTEKPTIVEDTPHSKLGASGSNRWMNCEGSVNLVDMVVKDLGPADLDAFERCGYAASEGTAAHTIAARCLENETDAWEYLGEKLIVDGREIEVDAEMSEGVQLHLDLVRRIMEEYADQGARLYVENSMSSMLDEDAFGTADVVIFVPGVVIIVIDFKYGRGVVVEPDCTQVRYYGYLVCENFESNGIEEVQLWITQPRIPHPKGKCRRHVTTRTEIEHWFTTDVLKAMQATRNPDANLTIGDWCRFCPARDACPALRKEVMDFDMTLEPAYMTGEELGRILQTGDAITRYLSTLGEEAYKRARRGEEVAGYKLVKKKANRVWKSGAEEAIKKKFGDKAYAQPKFLGPPAIEKLEGGKKLVARYAYSPDTGLTLAPNSDKREAIKLTGEEFFGDESEI